MTQGVVLALIGAAIATIVILLILTFAKKNSPPF